MKVRALSDTNDWQFGYPSSQFLVNTPAAVAQTILCRLRLLQGEWILDTTQGTPYSTQILGKHAQAAADLAFREVILDTLGVVSIDAFSSTLDASTRIYSMSCTVTTLYGTTDVIYTL